MEPRGPTHLEELIAQAAGLRRLAVRLVGESDADDVLQEAMTAGMEHAPGNPRELRPWLAQVVRNFAAGRHRGEGRRKAREVDVARREALPSASDLVERMEVQRIVAEEVLRLEEPYRTTVLALHFEGVSAEDHARSLNVPSATVRSWSKRGLDALRARLDRRFGGDRAAWSACLLPLARPEAALVPIAIGGGLVLKKVFAASLVVLLAAFVVWTAFGIGGGSESGSRPDDVAALELEARSGPARTDAVVPAPATELRAEVAAAPEPEPRTGPRVTGRVVWIPDRAPAADIGVRLAPAEPRPDLGVPPSVTTDAEGRFRIDAAGAGAFDLYLDRAQSAKRIRLAPDESLEVELELRRAATVIGRVLDEDGTPVAGAEICISAYKAAWSRCVSRSAADGSYAIEGVPVGPRVFARAPGRSSSGAYLLQDVNTPYALDLWLGGPPGAIEGQVRDATGTALVGIPLEVQAVSETVTDPAGVRASITIPEHATTGVLGAFAFRELRPGRNVLAVHTRNRTSFSIAIDVRSGSTARVDVDLPATARVRGRITDVSGKPAAGATIEVARVDGTSASTWIGTDGEGRYDTGFAPAGRVRLTVQHDRGHEVVVTNLAPDEDREWSPVLGATGPIRGRVVDLLGRPLAGVPVSCGGGREDRVATDATGRFELTARLAQPATVRAWEDDTVRAVRNDAWPGGPDVELVFEVPTARIRGRLIDAGHQLGPGIRLACSGRQVLFDAEGRFESHVLHSGKQTLDLQPYGVGSCRLLDVDLAPGETRDVGDVIVPGRGTLVVALHPDEHVDPRRVEIGAHRLGADWQVLYSHGANAGRDWTADGLPEGSYRLSISGGGAALVEKRFVIRPGESTLVDVDLRRGVPVRVEARGERIPRLEAEVRDEAGELVGWGNDPANGTEWVLSLRPGRYDIVLTAKDGRTGRARVDVLDQATIEQFVSIEVP